MADKGGARQKAIMTSESASRATEPEAEARVACLGRRLCAPMHEPASRYVLRLTFPRSDTPEFHVLKNGGDITADTVLRGDAEPVH